MTGQLALFETPAPPSTSKAVAAKAPRPSIGQRFEAFCRDNPHVMDELLRLARARLGRGETRIAVKALWEELRTELAKAEDGGLGPQHSRYKLDNSYTALYARRLIDLVPELDGVIETRKRKAK